MDFFLEKFKNYVHLDSSESDIKLPVLLCNYLVVSSICTDIIKSLLDENKDLVIQSNLKYSYYYLKKKNRMSHDYITFVRKEDPRSSDEYYVIVYSKITSHIVCSFLTMLFVGSPKQRVLNVRESRHIYTSSSSSSLSLSSVGNGDIEVGYKIFWSTIQTGKPHVIQNKILSAILKHWKNNDFNTKIILSGPHNSGKLSIGSLLKTYLEYYDPQFKDKTCVNLFDDIDLSLQFDPVSLINNWCSSSTPVIMTVRGIDQYYRNSIQGDIYNPKSPVHNKTSFNNFLDSIESQANIITIFTTNLSKNQLENIRDNMGCYQSYSRKGRVDLFIKIEGDSISVTEL